MYQEPHVNFVVVVTLNNGGKQTFSILARTKYEAVEKVYNAKNFKARQPERKKYKVIKPLLKLR